MRLVAITNMRLVGDVRRVSVLLDTFDKAAFASLSWPKEQDVVDGKCIQGR